MVCKSGIMFVPGNLMSDVWSRYLCLGAVVIKRYMKGVQHESAYEYFYSWTKKYNMVSEKDFSSSTSECCTKL